MGKRLIGIITGVLAVLAAFSLLTMLFMPKYIEFNTDGRITAEYYREKTDIDVIFVGSSTVQAGISPMTLYREYGILSYDRSNSSQIIPLSYYIAEDAIKRNKPQLVVCDVGFIYQSDDYVDEGASRKSLDSMKWSKSKSDAIKALMDESEHYIDYVFPILRFHSRWNDLNMEDLKYWVYKPSVTHNGQLLQFDENKMWQYYNPYNLEEGTVASERNISYLQKLADLCKTNGVELALIKMPYVEGNWCHSLDSQMKTFADENGLLYKSFIEDFESIGLDPKTEFSDVQHMNSIGAEKFTKVLGEYIIENYDVSDRRSDNVCSKEFDKKLSRYNYAMENKIPAESKNQEE